MVETVLINWKRPQNVRRIVQRLRQQSEKCLVTVVDCSAPPGLPEDVAADVDHLYRIRDNYLAYSRFIPAFNYTEEYTFFLDDDMLPGRCCIEHFLAAFGRAKGAGALGQIGRRVRGHYMPEDVSRGRDFVPVDLLVRAHFVRTEYLPDVLRLRHHVPGLVREDDMLLAAALTHLSDRRLLLTPTASPEESINQEELDAAAALSSQPDHLGRRDTFWKEINGIARRIGPVRIGPVRIGNGPDRNRA